MIAKIIKGSDFGGVVNYMLGKKEGEAHILQAEGVRSDHPNNISRDFALQASMRPNVQKPVGHIILSFSGKDAEQLTDAKMVQIAGEYLRQMEYGDTQILIVRHSDRQHPHLHICLNRIGNDGKTINDRNEKYRSTKVCRELTEKYGLTWGEGKQHVNRNRLRGGDKLRYEMFDAIKAVLPEALSWQDFRQRLHQHGIAIHLKTKGNTDVVQGIIFEKDGCRMSGSKIDRSCSFSCIHAQIKENIRRQESFLSQHEPIPYSVDESALTSDLAKALDEIFTIPQPGNGMDVDEIRFQRKLRKQANRKRRF